MSDHRLYFLCLPAMSICCLLALPAFAAEPALTANLVRDIEPVVSEGSSGPNTFVRMGGRSYFFARDVQHSDELWTTDGTPEGTWMVKDINPGRSGSSNLGLSKLIAGEQVLWMIRDDGIHGSELWRSDGTAAGTHLVKEINSGPNGVLLSIFFPWQDLVFFGYSSQLWVSDGTPAGTAVLDGLQSPFDIEALDSTQVVIRANSATGSGLWTSDGTNAGTTKFFSLCTNNCLSGAGLIALGDRLYFRHLDQLWQTDGTIAGTGMVFDLGNGYFNITATAHALYLASTNEFNQTVIWVSDGTAAGTIQLKVLSSDQRLNTYAGFKRCGSHVLFTADGTSSSELWRSDGTVSGTEMVRGDLHSVGAMSPDVGGKVLFSAESTGNGTELWVSDGTSDGTYELVDIFPGEPSSYPASNSLIGFGSLDPDAVLFCARDQEDSELWISDGTAAGTQEINLAAATGSSNPVHLTALAEDVLFTASVNEVRQLWRSDGSFSGTIPISGDLQVAQGSKLVAGNGKIYFSGIDPSYGGQPCVSVDQRRHARWDLPRR